MDANSPQILLRQLGLSDKEIVVYLTVLQQGKITPTDIASLTGINRTTVYMLAKELLKGGFIQQEAGKRTYLMARPLQDLHLLVEEEQAALHRKEHAVEQLVSSLEMLRGGGRYQVPRLTFIEEGELLKYLYRQTESWNKSIMETDGIWHGYQDHSFVEHYEEWIDWYWTQPWGRKIDLRLFTNDTQVEKKMRGKRYENRRMKWWGDTEITSTLWINGDHVVVIVTRTRPHYLFEIHDKLLAGNLREVCARLWKEER